MFDGTNGKQAGAGSPMTDLTSMSLIEQLRITPSELRRRRRQLDLGEKDHELLRKLKPVVSSRIEEVVDTFYEEQTAIPEVMRLIGDSETLVRLKCHLSTYILTLFDGLYDEEYILSRLRVGLVHKRIGVEFKYYLAAMRRLSALLRNVLLEGMAEESRAECNRHIRVLEKIMYFDLTLVFDTYVHGLLNELEHSKSELEEYSRYLEDEVARRTTQLESMARTDGLTGLINQRTFRMELRRELLRNIRNESRMTLAYIDMDGFKGVNDTFGHDEGDRVITQLAEALQECIREIDIAARIGGDEFAVILPETGTSGAESAFQRLTEVFSDKIGSHKVTLSIGLVELDGNSPEDIDALIRRADAAMYRAKSRRGHAIHNAG